MAKSSAKKQAPKKAVKKPAKKPAAKAKPATTSTKKPSGGFLKKVISKVVMKSSANKSAAKSTVKASAGKSSAEKPASGSAKTKTPLVKGTSSGTTPPRKPARTYKAAKVPHGYKPTEKEEYMNPVQLEYFRQKLLNWRRELIDESRETLDHLHEENWHQADIADRASLETEAGVELRTRNRYLKLIAKIDSAVRRIEEGEYGYCEETGEPIGLKRLEARPVATLSIEAQERHEKMERQVADEE
jgi:DnaK suppressor protein